MLRTILTYAILLIFGSLAAQPENDNCENAKDITDVAFNLDTFEDLYTFTEFSGATVDASNYGSNMCWFGYAEQTTDAFPDVWLKSNLHLSYNLAQVVTFYTQDSFELATYFGTCDNLYQSECFTMAPGDTTFNSSLFLEYAPHDIDHSMYFQLKAPSTTYDFQIEFDQNVYFLVTYYFGYDNPADTSNTTSTNSTNQPFPIIKLFPMPAREYINIESTDEIKFLEVFNLTGKRLLTEQVNSSSAKINTNQLSPGMYFIKIETKNGWSIQNFAVAH